MSVYSKDFLNKAEQSRLDEEQEISLRCSIRNAYYAAYHRAHELLNNEPVVYGNCGVHQSFIAYLGEEAHRHEENLERNALKRLALKLGQMKAARVVADYDLEDTVNKDLADIILKQSRSFFELCDVLSNENAA
jgi:uncharacterized protein (UPF0332 family)